MSPDPSQLYYADRTDPQGLNLYAYALNNPLTNLDPTGLSCVSLDGGAFADDGDGKGCDSAGINPDGSDQNPFYNRFDYRGDAGIVTGSNSLGGNLPSTRPSTPPPAPSKNCQAGPLNLSQNIQVAQSLTGQLWSGLLNAASPGEAASAGGAAAAYIGLVQTGGAWDPKTTIAPTPENFAAGNINFGATCSQFGFNTAAGGFLCQVGAGLYQHHTDGHFQSPFFSRYHGDVPRDNQQIRQGLAIAKKGDC